MSVATALQSNDGCVPVCDFTMDYTGMFDLQ